MYAEYEADLAENAGVAGITKQHTGKSNVTDGDRERGRESGRDTEGAGRREQDQDSNSEPVDAGLGWPGRVQALIKAGDYLPALEARYQAELDALADNADPTLAEHEKVELAGLSLECPLPWD